MHFPARLATAFSNGMAGLCLVLSLASCIYGPASVEGVPPRRVPDLPAWSWYSGTEALVLRPETNFVMIGERTNITGSPKFSKLILGGNLPRTTP